jgi:MarR family
MSPHPGTPDRGVHKGDELLILAARLVRSKQDEVLAPLGLTPAAVLALEGIAPQPIGQEQLASVLRVSTQTLGRLLARLETAGLLTGTRKSDGPPPTRSAADSGRGGGPGRGPPIRGHYQPGRGGHRELDSTAGGAHQVCGIPGSTATSIRSPAAASGAREQPPEYQTGNSPGSGGTGFGFGGSRKGSRWESGGFRAGRSAASMRHWGAEVEEDNHRHQTQSEENPGTCTPSF